MARTGPTALAGMKQLGLAGRALALKIWKPGP